MRMGTRKTIGIQALYKPKKKCLFYITSINFLGFIISVNRVLIKKS